jgi:hypothetical protein
VNQGTTSHNIDVCLRETRNWPIVKRIQQSGNQGKALVPSLLSCLIKESQALGGTVLDQFWEAVGKCDDKLKDNSGSNSSASECQGLTSIYS